MACAWFFPASSTAAPAPRTCLSPEPRQQSNADHWARAAETSQNDLHCNRQSTLTTTMLVSAGEWSGSTYGIGALPFDTVDLAHERDRPPPPLTRDNPPLSRPTTGGLVVPESSDVEPSSIVKEYVRDSISDNTKRAYRSDLRHELGVFVQRRIVLV